MSKCDKLSKLEKKASASRPCLAICAGKHCAKAGAKQIIRAVSAALDEAGMSNTVAVALTECQDHCDDAPAITALPGPYPYIDLAPADVRTIVAEHLGRGRPVRSLLHKRARKLLERI